MWNRTKVIDVHGHMSTPPEFRAAVSGMVSGNTPLERFELSDARLETALKRHLEVMDVRNIDYQLVGPRPIAMWHWMRPFLQEAWCRITNDVIAQSVKLHPDRFVGMAQLPQNRDLDTSHCVPEFKRCVQEMGFVGAYLNPDPAGDKQTPALCEEYWYPLYEASQELNAPLLLHPSITYDRRVEGVPANYQLNNLTEEYISTMILEWSNVFEVFPRLKICICHLGGALQRFILEDGRHIGQKDLSNNLFFDSCAYQRDFLSAGIRQKGVNRVCFGSEAPGSGGAIRKDTGRPSDDLVPIIDEIDWLTSGDKVKIFNTNPLKVFPKVDARKAGTAAAAAGVPA